MAKFIVRVVKDDCAKNAWMVTISAYIRFERVCYVPMRGLSRQEADRVAAPLSYAFEFGLIEGRAALVATDVPNVSYEPEVDDA
jgi:hypothetical protein